MRITSHITAGVIGAATVTCAALLIPAVALASPARSTATTRPAAATPACQTSALRSWLGIPGDGYAGGDGYQLEVSNISKSACTLFGYPGVSALAAGGKQLGSPAGRNPSHPSTTVTLAAGATAHVILQIADVANFPPATCVPATAVALRVYPPNTTVSEVVPFSFQACSKAGPVYMSVSTTLAGTGIPGFSS